MMEGYAALSSEPAPVSTNILPNKIHKPNTNPPTQPAQPQALQDVEKGSFASPSQVYGTFLEKSESNFDGEKSQVVVVKRRLLDNIWWALAASLMVVGTITVYAIVIASAAL